MLFSDQFHIDLDGREDWFDPLLSSDIKLFIDPFLIFQNEFGAFKGAHSEIIDFYEYAFNCVAKAAGQRGSGYWIKALSILKTPEAEEFCLGFTARGTDGAGAGGGKARLLAEGLEKAIAFGLSSPEHFETVQLFREKIGRDTISDATANILRVRFAKYTERICKKLSLETKTVLHPRAKFDFVRGRWEAANLTAPINPFNGKQILLCPKAYLKPLPTINPKDYWGYCFDEDPDDLRREFGEEITRSVKKEIIIENALTHFDSVESFVEFLKSTGVAPYDIDSDPKGLVRWYHTTRDYIASHPVRARIKDETDLEKFIDEIIQAFQTFIEDNGGWKLMFSDDGTPRSEEICQLAFLGIVKHICHQNDIDVSKEANIGRGPVDFKLSRGIELRALIEMKLVSNTKFWNGLERQLPKYLAAEGVRVGKFLIIAFDSDELGKVKDAQNRARDLTKKLKYKLTSKTVLVEYKPPSASKL
jgi:hypothetical protein